MSGLSSLYKDTLKIWDTITYITLDTKECTEAKANIASDPMNNQYCYDLIKAGNDIYKTHLSKYSSYHKKMLDAKKDIEKAYNLNKQSAKLQEGLHNYNEDLNNQMKKMNELNSVIRRNNELMDVLQAEMIHSNKHREHKESEHKHKHKHSEHKNSDKEYYDKVLSGIYSKANAKSYGDLMDMLQAETNEEYKHGNVEYKDVRDEYITKLTGICALDEQTTKLDDLTPYKTNTTRIKQMTTIQKEALSIFTKKNHDYGDSFATYGPTGVIVRIGDKIQRLQSITRKGITMVNDESIRDTLMDLHNYCAMAIMLMDEDNDNLSSTMDTSLFLNTNENIVICEPGFGMYTVGDLQRQG
jgi:hypothetical protein